MAKPAWKKFEEGVEAYFKARMEHEPIVYHRFYDTHSAGSFLPNQPGDHYIKTLTHSILLETKHSEVHASLRSCFSNMVEDSQIAHMRVWMRAGSLTLVLFKGTNGLELWDGGHCAHCRLHGRRLDSDRILSSRRTIAEVFKDAYLWFPGTEMRWKIL